MKKIAVMLAAISFIAPALASSNNVIDTTNVQINKIEKKGIESDIIISEAWIRQPTVTSVNTAAYFKIYNGTDVDIKIVDAIAEKGICKNTEIHGYKPDDKGVMKMFKLESITIPAKTTIEFKPGSNHIMLMGLKKTLSAGSSYNIELKMLPASSDHKVVVPNFLIQFPVK